MYPGNWRKSLEEEEAGSRAICRLQAVVRQYSRPAKGVTGDVRIKEKDDFCLESYEMPMVSWKYSHELEGRECGVHSHVHATGRR